MHPLVSSMASGHGSDVTPKSVWMPASSVVGPPSSLRQPATAPAIRIVAADAATIREVSLMRIPFLLFLVGERPRFPVVAQAQPDAEQPPWFEDQKDDHQRPVEDPLDLEDIGGDGWVVAENRNELGQQSGDDRQID